MKFRNLFVMGMVATTLVNTVEAQRRDGNRGNRPGNGGFNNGQMRNQDLFQIRELQQTYKEYMVASRKLKRLYIDLDDVTTKLGRNQTIITELREQRRGAKLALEEKGNQISNFERRVSRLMTEKDQILINIVTLEGEIQSIDTEIESEKTRLAPFIQAEKQKQKALSNFQPTYDQKQVAVAAANRKVGAAQSKMDSAKAQAAQVKRALSGQQARLAAETKKLERFENQLEPLRQHSSKIAEVNEMQKKIDNYNDRIKKYFWKRDDKRKWKRERDILEAKKKAIIRTMPNNAVQNYNRLIVAVKGAKIQQNRAQVVVNRTTKQLSQLENKATQAGTELEVAKIEKSDALKALAPAKAKHDKLSKALSKASKKLDQQSGKLNTLKSNKRSKKSTLVSINNDLEDTEGKLARAQRNLNETQAQAAQIAADLQDFQQKIQQKKERIAELESNKNNMEQTELALFERMQNSYVRTHNNKVFNMFIGGLNAITPQMREKLRLAAATGAKIMLWGDLTNEELMSRIAPITGVVGSAVLPISEIQGVTQSTQNFSLNVRMETLELNIDQGAVPVLMTADQRVIMSAKLDIDFGAVITTALNPNDLNEFDMKALLEMIAYSDISEYQPVITDPSDGGNGGDIPGDDGDQGGDYPGDTPGDDGDQGGDYPGDTPGDGDIQTFSTVFKDTESKAISEVIDGKETLTYKMDIDSEKGFTLSNVELSVEATHSYIGDIQVYLTSPSGKTIELRKNQGGRGKSMNDIYSQEIMDAFSGEMIRGLWVLTIKDGYKDRDVGSVNAVRFSIEGERQ